MLDVAIMVEGQDGLTWTRWQRLARAAEELGFAGLYRSDHLTNPTGPHLDALELWASLTWLAGHTSRIEFGPLVSPVSFRHPVVTAWTAAAVDDLSGGRLRLGLGAGWQEREHASYGFDLLDTDRRFARFAEGVQVVRRLLRSDAPSSFAGEFYRLDDAVLLSRPRRPGGPPIVIGGNGTKRTLPLAARYADEWNAVFVPAARFADLNARLDDLLREEGRPPSAVRRTLMTWVVFGRDAAEAATKLRNGQTVEEIRARGVVVGGPDDVTEQLRELAGVGVERVMAQWLERDGLAGLEALSRSVLSRL